MALAQASDPDEAPLLAAPAARPPLAPKPKPGPGSGAVKAPPADPGGGGSKGPAPSGPPGSAAFGTGSSAPSGLSSALWCDLIVVLLALACCSPRRHRLPLALSAPTGFTPLLQRPG
jgi:hypothetical protein